jgi:hypothetical protein
MQIHANKSDLPNTHTVLPRVAPPRSGAWRHNTYSITLSEADGLLRCQIRGGAIHGDNLVARNFARNAQQNGVREA